MGYSFLDRFSVKLSLLVFVVGSTGDIITTWYGYSNGLSEFSPIVEYLLINYGTLTGVLLSKIIALVVILAMSLVTAAYWSKFGDKEYEKILQSMVRDLFVIAGVIYIGASLNNLIVIVLYLT